MVSDQNRKLSPHGSLIPPNLENHNSRCVLSLTSHTTGAQAITKRECGPITSRRNRAIVKQLHLRPPRVWQLLSTHHTRLQTHEVALLLTTGLPNDFSNFWIKKKGQGRPSGAKCAAFSKGECPIIICWPMWWGMAIAWCMWW